MSKLAVAVLAVSVPLFAEGPKQNVEVTTTQRLDLASSGTLRVSASCGQLNIEGWDQAAVEVILTRSKFSGEAERNDATLFLSAIRVNAERQPDNVLAISTTFPRGRSFPHPFQCKKGVSLDYRIKAPRSARLILRQKNGDIVLYNVGGEIEATNRTGTIVAQLTAGQYSLDARCKVGGVDSDLGGVYHGQHLIGERFFGDAPKASSHKIYLRVGFGRIDIQQVVNPTSPPAVH